PFVGLGIQLARRGHQVRVITNGHFRSVVEKAGLEFVELGTAEEYREAISHRDMWHPRRGVKLLLQYTLVLARPLSDKLTELYEPGRTVVVHSPIGYGARIAQEKHGLPLATVHLAPSTLRSILSPPVLAGAFVPGWSPLWWRRIMFRLID